MEAKSVCEKLLSSIKNSGLNFVLTETPFSVNIVLKKTFTKTKESGPKATNSEPSKRADITQAHIHCLKTYAL